MRHRTRHHALTDLRAGRRRATGVASLTLAAGLILASCTSSLDSPEDDSESIPARDRGEVTYSDTPTTETPSTTTEDAAIDDGAADERIPETIRTMFDWHFAEDDTPADAVDRARDYLTADWIKETEDIWTGLTAASSGQWAEWKQHGAVNTQVEVTESEDERPADSDTTVYRGYTVNQRFTTDEDRLVSIREFHIFTVSSLVDGRWKIAYLTIID